MLIIAVIKAQHVLFFAFAVDKIRIQNTNMSPNSIINSHTYICFVNNYITMGIFAARRPTLSANPISCGPQTPPGEWARPGQASQSIIIMLLRAFDYLNLNISTLHFRHLLFWRRRRSLLTYSLFAGVVAGPGHRSLR